MMYLAGRLNAGVMTDSPGAIGPSDLANNSSSGPAALCTIPETPLPARRLGWAEKTMISAPLCRMSLIRISSVICILMAQFSFILKGTDIVAARSALYFRKCICFSELYFLRRTASNIVRIYVVLARTMK